MATYTVTDTQVGAYAKTLSTVDTVTFNDESIATLEVTNEDGAAAIYFTLDGSTPVVAAAGTYHLPAAISSRTVRVPQIADATSVVVKLISSGTPVYSVAKP